MLISLSLSPHPVKCVFFLLTISLRYGESPEFLNYFLYYCYCSSDFYFLIYCCFSAFSDRSFLVMSSQSASRSSKLSKKNSSLLHLVLNIGVLRALIDTLFLGMRILRGFIWNEESCLLRHKLDLYFIKFEEDAV